MGIQMDQRATATGPDHYLSGNTSIECQVPLAEPIVSLRRAPPAPRIDLCLGRFSSRSFSPTEDAYPDHPKGAHGSIDEELALAFRGNLAQRPTPGTMSPIAALVTAFLQYTVHSPEFHKTMIGWANRLQQMAFRLRLTPEEARKAIGEAEKTYDEFHVTMSQTNMTSGLRDNLLTAFAKLREAVKADINSASK